MECVVPPTYILMCSALCPPTALECTSLQVRVSDVKQHQPLVLLCYRGVVATNFRSLRVPNYGENIGRPMSWRNLKYQITEQ